MNMAPGLPSLGVGAGWGDGLLALVFRGGASTAVGMAGPFVLLAFLDVSSL
jgi:hypothetical protein